LTSDDSRNIGNHSRISMDAWRDDSNKFRDHSLNTAEQQEFTCFAQQKHTKRHFTTTKNTDKNMFSHLYM